jgi:transposase
MLTVTDREAIRRAYHLEKKSIRAIARELHHSRETVKQALTDAAPTKYTLTQPRGAPVLGPYKARIQELLAENEHLPRKQRYTSSKILEIISAEGYTGAASTLRGYVSQLRRRHRQKRLVYVPLEFAPGEAAQVDWGEAQILLAGDLHTAQMFVMWLCYSRRMFVMAFPTQRQEAFFMGHVHAFNFFQGVPQTLIYDNLKTAVYRILDGRNRIEQQRFVQLRSHYLFDSRFCTPGQGHEKGGVEAGVGYAQRHYFVPLPQVADWDALNAHLLAVCHANDARTVDRQPQPIGLAWQQEQPQLRPLPAYAFDGAVSREVTLNGYSQVTFESNRYSVPTDHAYRQLVLRATPFEVRILHQDQVLATHPRCYDHAQDIVDPLHYLPLLAQRPGAFDHAQPLRQWREQWPPEYEQLLARLRQQWPDGRGLREFVQILQLHADYPADQITQAVQQALDYGAAHLAGVRLCLHTLQHPDTPVPPVDLTAHPELAAVGEPPPDLRQYEQLLLGVAA